MMAAAATSMTSQRTCLGPPVLMFADYYGRFFVRGHLVYGRWLYARLLDVDTSRAFGTPEEEVSLDRRAVGGVADAVDADQTQTTRE